MTKFIKVLLFALLLLAGVAAQAATYTFPGYLPGGCTGSAGIYACGTLSLAAGESIAIVSNPTTITFSGAFVTGGGVEINANDTLNLNIVVNGAVTLGAGSTLNGNLTTHGAGAVTIDIGSWISGNVSTETGFVAMGAAPTPVSSLLCSLLELLLGLCPPPDKTGVGGSISTGTGYVGLGAGAIVGGTVNTVIGYVSLGAGASIGGPVITQSAGYVSLGDGSTINGSIVAQGAGTVAVGANAYVKGSITASGTTGADFVTTGDSSHVTGNISTAGSYITIGANSQVGGDVSAETLYITLDANATVSGNISTKNGYVTVGADCEVLGQIATHNFTDGIFIGARSDVFSVCCNQTDATCLTNTSVYQPLVCVTHARFECLETKSVLPASLFTKLAGTLFAFDVMALNADGTQNRSFGTKSVKLELVEGSGVTACASRRPLASAVLQTLGFLTTDYGRKTAANMTVSNAYTDLRCRVTYGTTVACSNDNFAVRPASATLWTTAIAPYPATVPMVPSASATPAFKAGASFSLGAKTDPVAGYTGILKLVENTQTLATNKLSAQTTTLDSSQQSGGVVGTLSPTALTANATITTDATYSEVGYLYLAAGAYRDDAWTKVDSDTGDCITAKVDSVNYLSDTLVGGPPGKYGCSIGNNNKDPVSLGRFYPDHFALTSSVLTPGCVTAVSSNSFTYMDQPFNLKATVEAKNLSNFTTKNFSGSDFGMAAVVPQLVNVINGVYKMVNPTRLTGLVENPA